MSSLQDQLFKAGLASKDKLTKAKDAQRKQKNLNRKHKIDSESESQSEAKKILADKAAKAKQLNLKKNTQAEDKAVVAQIKQLIESNQQNYGKPQVVFNFSVEGKIKEINVSHEVHKYLTKGYLAITKSIMLNSGDNKNQSEIYPIIPASIAEKIMQRSSDYILLYSKKDEYSLENKKLDDDPYAEYEVPDDLMW